MRLLYHSKLFAHALVFTSLTFAFHVLLPNVDLCLKGVLLLLLQLVFQVISLLL